MRYLSFRIQNFKGIIDCKIRLDAKSGGRVFPLVGLNESGKTTLLEALYMFSYQKYTEQIFDDRTLMIGSWEGNIPRNKLGNFTGAISIKAELFLSARDKDAICSYAKKELDLSLDRRRLASSFFIDSRKYFKDSKVSESINEWSIDFYNKVGKIPKKVNEDQWRQIVEYIEHLIPPIYYYPTFLFEFPARIYLCDGHGAKNDFFRKIVQNILDEQGGNLDLKKHIYDRYNSDSAYSSATVFAKSFPDIERAKIDSVVMTLSDAVSKFILRRWNEIFQEEQFDRSVVIECKTEHKENVVEPYLVFSIRDGSGQFAVDERSLGFRWFFCFMLFTHYCPKKERDPGVVFLFDEPAANLHSSAQQKLLATFGSITNEKTFLIYSTHSHYMINPYWLEQTFIVKNKSVDPIKITSPFGVPTEIIATPYRQYVSDSANNTTYYQPILDAIEYRPSDLEFVSDAVFLEGKSDYAILKYAASVLLSKDIVLIPCLGANDVGAVIALYCGWGKRFVVLLDSDKAGLQAKQTYLSHYPNIAENIFMLGDLVGAASIKKIEDILELGDKQIIADHFKLQSSPNKKQIMAFFQEALATKQSHSFSDELSMRSAAIIDQLLEKLAKASRAGK